jgi:hypothetical protein
MFRHCPDCEDPEGCAEEQECELEEDEEDEDDEGFDADELGLDPEEDLHG